MKLIQHNAGFIILMILFAGLGGCNSSYPAASSTSYSNPDWAPPYYAGVRYYYLPDIETYYDLSNHDFAYIDNGLWVFSSSLPSMYSNYDLHNCFAVALNHRVFQPWMHHQNYASNYPRYYYRNKYQGSQNIGIRGFNENNRQPVFRRDGGQQQGGGQVKPNRQGSDQPVARPPQQPTYRGKQVGQPVRVRPYMRENGNGNNRQNNNTNNGNSGNQRPAKRP